MQTHRLLLATLMLATPLLAGCASDAGGDAATGTLTVTMQDSAPAAVTIAVQGGYAQKAGNGTWHAFADEADAASWTLSGGGQPSAISGKVPAGDYGRFRVVFSSVTQGTRQAVMTESGLELPLAFSVPSGGEVTIRLNLSWADALYESSEGLTFTPALQGLGVRSGEGAERAIERDEIVAASKLPVARMQVFDGKGFAAFTSDFVAESPLKPAIATAGNFTFSGSLSEAVQANANITQWLWNFDDGTSASGFTVWKEFPLSGGNHTVRLEVIDSAGNRDAQTVEFAMRPGTGSQAWGFNGTVSGFKQCLGATCTPDPSGGGPESHGFPVVNDTYSGGPAQLTRVQASLALGTGQSSTLTDVSLAILDGAGTSVATGASIDADLTGRTLVGGNWTAVVDPKVASEVPYTVAVKLTWAGIGDEDYLAWLETYDDGHTHQH